MNLNYKMAGIRNFVLSSADHLRQAAEHFRVPIDELVHHIAAMTMDSDDEAEHGQHGGSVEQWNAFRKANKLRIEKYANEHLMTKQEAASKLYPQVMAEKGEAIIGLKHNGVAAERSKGLEEWSDFIHHYRDPEGATGYERLQHAVDAYRVAHPKKGEYKGLHYKADGSIKYANPYTLYMRLIKKDRALRQQSPATRDWLSSSYELLVKNGTLYTDLQRMINDLPQRTEAETQFKMDSQAILNQVKATDENKRANAIRMEHLRTVNRLSVPQHTLPQSLLAPALPSAPVAPGALPAIPGFDPTQHGSGSFLS